MTEEELKALADRFRQKLALDPEIRSLSKKIADGTADFSDTSKLFWRRSVMLREYTQDTVLDLAPEDRQRLVEALLHRGYDDTTEALTIVQETLDKAQGLHLNPVVPKYPAERVATVAHALMDPTVPEEKIVRRAGAPVANVNMSFHDKYMEENARIRAKLGMKPTITRYGSGCCKWCSEVAGRYRFGDQPKDIFRRHDNCDCVIIYDTQVLRGHRNEDGSTSRAWEEVDPAEVMANGFQPAVLSADQADHLNFIGKLKNALSGNQYQKTVVEFADQLPNIQNQNVATILQRALSNAKINKSQRRNSYFSKKDETIYLSKTASTSTVAHELFHKLDFEYGISNQGLLDDCIQSDYEKLIKLSETSGQTVEDMLYLKYPEMFKTPGKFKEEYRGLSDILNGMSGGKINFGYKHDTEYWNKPRALQKETFAQYGRMYYEENPDVLKVVRSVLPDTTIQINSIIADIAK